MLALALLLAVQPAQDTLHYTFESVNSQDIDATAAGQGVMQNKMTLSGRMHVVLSDTTGGMLAHVVIDTTEFKSSNPQMGMIAMSVPSGTAFHLYVVDGEVKSGLEPPAMGPAMNLGVFQALGIVGNLFPKMRNDVAVGDHWTDTTTTDSLTAGGRVTNQGITAWRVDDRQGDRVSYTGNLTGSISAELEQGTMTGTTSGTQQLTLTPGQPVHRSESTINADIQMLMGQAALSLKQEQRIVITRQP